MYYETIPQKPNKKNKIIVIAIVTSFIIMCIIFKWLLGFICVTKYKFFFSDAEKARIATELDIPIEKIKIKSMKYSHARETCVFVNVEASSLDVLNSYEYHGPERMEEKPLYIKKGENPHYDIACIVKSENPYKLHFKLSDTWNKNLYSIIA